jgi:hypothetical protein
LAEVDLPVKFIKTWKKLIDVRLKEYRRDYLVACREASFHQEFQGKNQVFRNVWARIETLTVVSLHHLRRGKTVSGDPLRNQLRRWLFHLNIKMAKIIQEVQSQS